GALQGFDLQEGAGLVAQLRKLLLLAADPLLSGQRARSPDGPGEGQAPSHHLTHAEGLTDIVDGGERSRQEPARSPKVCGARFGVRRGDASRRMGLEASGMPGAGTSAGAKPARNQDRLPHRCQDSTSRMYKLQAPARVPARHAEACATSAPHARAYVLWGGP